MVAVQSYRCRTWLHKISLVAVGILFFSLGGCVSIPPEAEKHWHEGEKAWKAKDYSQAKKHFQKALELYPEYRKAHLYLGEIYKREKNYAQALKEFQSYLKYKPTSVKALLGVAFCLRNQGKFHQALGVYEQIQSLAKNGEIKLTPEHRFELDFGLALSYLGLGKPEETLQYLDRCIGQRPNDPWVYYYRGVAWEQQGGMFDKAIREYEQALAVDPKFAKAHRALGYLYYVYYRDAKNWKQKALRHYREFLKVSQSQDATVLARIRELEGKKPAAKTPPKVKEVLKCPLCGRKYPLGSQKVCFFDGIPLQREKE